MSAFGGFYGPTYFFLKDQEGQNQELLDLNQAVNLPYTRRVTPFQPSKKGKKREIQDPELEREHAWVLEELARRDQQIAEKVNEEEYEVCGDGIECGCCFSEYPFVGDPLETMSPLNLIPSRYRIRWFNVQKLTCSAIPACCHMPRHFLENTTPTSNACISRDVPSPSRVPSSSVSFRRTLWTSGSA